MLRPHVTPTPFPLLKYKFISKYDENSKSELCIPFEISDIKYVLDVDSNNYNAFCKIDEKYLKEIIKEI